jgi:hypothetical protein
MTRAEMVTLRDYIDTRFSELDKRFEGIDRAVDLAQAGVNQRLEGMNEFREQLRSQAATFVTSTEIEAKMNTANATHAEQDRRLQLLEQNKLNVTAHDTLEKRIQVLEQNIANLEGRFWAISVGFGVVTLAINIALHFIK